MIITLGACSWDITRSVETTIIQASEKEIPLYKTSTIRKSQIVRHTKEKNMEVFKVNEFDFEVIRVEEYEDGSADLEIHMSEESKRFLINYAFLDIIKKAAGQFEEHFDDNIEAIQVPDRPIEFDWSHEKGAEVRTDVNQGNSKLDETQK